MSGQRFVCEDCGREFEESLIEREDEPLACPYCEGLDLQPVGEPTQGDAD